MMPATTSTSALQSTGIAEAVDSTPLSVTVTFSTPAAASTATARHRAEGDNNDKNDKSDKNDDNSEKEKTDLTADLTMAARLCALGADYYNGKSVPKNLQKAVEYFQPAANLGNAVAQWYLAFCYENGFGIAKDLNQAFHYYQLSAKQGNISAHNNLGRCYRAGYGTKVDLSLAFHYYQLAAKEGDEYGQHNLGNCYENGFGTEKNLILAFHYYQLTAKQGNNTSAQKNLERIKKDFKLQDYYDLGLKYFHGDGVPKDLQMAAELWQVSAKNSFFENGHAESQHALGCCYQSGEGVTKDSKKAFEWFHLAGEQQHTKAQYQVGRCYEWGEGVAKNNKKAFKHYEQAASQKYAAGQNAVGVCYYKGKGVRRDLSKAREFFQLSVEQDYSCAQYNLGLCYEYGIDVVEDIEKAISLYQSAIKQNSSDAKMNLGVLFSRGQGVSKDPEKASELWRSIEKEAFEAQLSFAEQDDPWAQFFIGSCYEFGVGFPKNFNKAKEFYEKSAGQEDPVGQKNLDRFKKENPKLFIPAEFFSTTNKSAVNKAASDPAAITSTPGAATAVTAVAVGAEPTGPAAAALVTTSPAATTTANASQAVISVVEPDATEVAAETATKTATPVALPVAAAGHSSAAKSIISAVSSLFSFSSPSSPPSTTRPAATVTASRKYQLGRNFELGKGVPKDLKKAIYYYELAKSQGDEDARKSLERLKREEQSQRSESSKSSESVENSEREVAQNTALSSNSEDNSRDKTNPRNRRVAMSISLTKEQLIYLDSLKSAGINPTLLNSALRDIQSIMTTAHDMELVFQWMKILVPKFNQLETVLALTDQLLQKDTKTKREQNYINDHLKLKNYQKRIQQELCRFITCYYLAPAGIFKLEDNKKDTVISAIGSVPVFGSFLKPFAAILSYANKKNRFNQMNRISELFTDTNQIVEVCCKFSRQITLIKRDDIQKQVNKEYQGWKKIIGLFEEAKAIIEQQWKDLAYSDATGVALTSEDKLAIMDGAYLLQQILSGDARVEKEQDLADQFTMILCGKSDGFSPDPISSASSENNIAYDFCFKRSQANDRPLTIAATTAVAAGALDAANAANTANIIHAGNAANASNAVDGENVVSKLSVANGVSIANGAIVADAVIVANAVSIVSEASVANGHNARNTMYPNHIAAGAINNTINNKSVFFERTARASTLPYHPLSNVVSHNFGGTLGSNPTERLTQKEFVRLYERIKIFDEQMRIFADKTNAKVDALRIEKEQDRLREEAGQREISELKKKLEELMLGVPVDGGNSAQAYALPLASPKNLNNEEMLKSGVNDLRDEVTHHRLEILQLKAALDEHQVANSRNEDGGKKNLMNKSNEKCSIM